jgi:HSP20 family protein
MLTRWNPNWNEFDEMFSAMNNLKAYMDHTFEDAFVGRAVADRTVGGVWPRANVIDAGATMLVTAEVPGLSEKDIHLTLNQDVLTVSGQRKVEAPAGYSAHRQERAAVNFSRSFALPCRVNPEGTSASVKNGILTVTLEKAAEAMPRQITVEVAH